MLCRKMSNSFVLAQILLPMLLGGSWHKKKAVLNIEDQLKCDRIPMPSEIDALEQALQRNEELQQENEE